ncbi:LysM peptidoglycan-binding domain-containing protein [Rhodococcus sp. NPDC058521]|uniref:LysM peptidoglycan-binding domain-containing protein n=1 Tax=Rhodococcus sp. NPDC058521 TaxID=3346536 RepID=UPI0036544B5E
MSSAVLSRRAVDYAETDLGRAAHGRGPDVVREPRIADRRRGQRRPDSGAVRYMADHVRVSQADHRAVDIDVGWRTMLATVLVTAGILLGFGAVAYVVTATGDAALAEATEVVQVGAGESLTEVAERIAPEVPAQQIVDRIMDLNALTNSSVHAGQSLVVPALRG